MHSATPTMSAQDMEFFDLFRSVSEKAEVALSGKPLENAIEEPSKPTPVQLVDVGNQPDALSKQQISPEPTPQEPELTPEVKPVAKVSFE